VQVRAIRLNDKAGHAITLQQAAKSLEDFGRNAADQLTGVFRALDDAGSAGTSRPPSRPTPPSPPRARSDQPGYGFAEYCLGEMAKARKASPAEQLGHYTSAAKGDPLSLEAWSMAAVQYQNLGDSANTVKVFQEMLRVAPTNQPLREQAFRLFLNYGQPQAAKQVAEEGLVLDPSNADLWDLKSNACLFLEDFACAVDALEQVFAVDSAKADSTFYNKINVAASQKPDTARSLKWAQMAVRKYPTSSTAGPSPARTDTPGRLTPPRSSPSA
jgi:tetratricopeptide (TPR) repeat protein